MNWVDYREKLGVGIADDAKFRMCRNRVCNMLSSVRDEYYPEKCLFRYANCVGESIAELRQSHQYRFHAALNSVTEAATLPEFIAKYVALIHSAKDVVLTRPEEESEGTFAEILESVLTGTLRDYRVPYELIHDEDGVFIFPKGVPEFDKALVTDTCLWLSQFPETEKAWGKALKAYSDGADPSEVADQFRKTLERFFQNFFHSTKALENLKKVYGEYVRERGIPTELSGNLETVIQQYTNYMNNYAKHHDHTSCQVLEYLMYQTGNIMRLLITLKESEKEQ